MSRVGRKDEQFAFGIFLRETERVGGRGGRFADSAFAAEDHYSFYLRAFQILVPIFSNWPNPRTSSAISGT